MHQHVPMFENFVNEKKSIQPTDPLFWEDLDALLNLYYSSDESTESTNQFFEKWHGVLNGTNPQNVIGIINRLHDQGIVPKQVSFGDWLASLCSFVVDSINKTSSPIGIRFTSEVIKNGSLTGYRGVPVKMVQKEIDDIEDEYDYYKSFTLDYDAAKSFASEDWNQNIEHSHNGSLIICSVNVKDVHIFNNKGHKYEIILKTPLHVQKTVNLNDVPKPEKKEEKETSDHDVTG